MSNLRELLQQDVVNKWAENNYKGLALLGTGVGKTKIFIKAIKHKKPKNVLVLVNSEDLRDSELYKEFIKWRAKTWLKKCQFVCYQTAYKWIDKKFDMVIGDEIDFAINTKYWNFFNNNSYNSLLLLTATLPEEKEEFIKQSLPIFYRYTTQQAQKDKMLNSVKFFFVNYLLSDEKNIQFWRKVDNEWKKEILSENDIYLRYNERIAAIIDDMDDPYPKNYNLVSLDGEELKIELLNRITLERKMFLNTCKTSSDIAKKVKNIVLSNPENRVVIFSDFTAQSDKISPYTYHSNNESNNLKRFNNLEINELAVCAKINRGLNLVKCNTAIFEGFSRSRVAANQRVGRLTRLDVNDTATAFILVPHYFKMVNGKKEIRRTIIYDYVLKAFKDYDLSKIEIFKFPQNG